MHYAGQFTVTAVSTLKSQSSLKIIITEGILHSGIFFFPAGCRGTVYLHLDHAIHQIWPTNPSGTFAFENYVHEVKDYYRIPPGVKQLELKGYSVNADNDHTIQWAFTINRPEEVFPMLYGPLSKIEDISDVLRQWWPKIPTDTEGSEK